jgi:hypothetical protein
MVFILTVIRVGLQIFFLGFAIYSFIVRDYLQGLIVLAFLVIYYFVFTHKDFMAELKKQKEGKI